MRFANWDWRPAVLVDGRAFALLSPGSDWVEVDRLDVGHTSSLIEDETAFRALFSAEFGDFALPTATASAGSEASSAAE